MKTKYPILSILAAMLMLTGCESVALLVLTIPYKIAYRSEQETREALREKIEAGDLDASKHCVEKIDCGLHLALLPEETRRRAVENVLAAYQNDPDPELDKLAYLMLAHMRLWDSQVVHGKAILQLAQSKKLWDYANMEGSTVSDRFTDIQNVLYDTITIFLVRDHIARVSGDPYQAFVCDLTPYEREAFIVNARKPEHTKKSLCEKAESDWNGGALDQVFTDENLATAERLIFEYEKFRNNAENSAKHLFATGRQVYKLRYAACRIINAYENNPNLDAHQQEALKLSREIPLGNDRC